MVIFSEIDSHPCVFTCFSFGPNLNRQSDELMMPNLYSCIICLYTLSFPAYIYIYIYGMNLIIDSSRLVLVNANYYTAK